MIESFEGHDLSSMLSETRQRRGGKVSAIQYGMNFGDKETRQNLQLLLKQYFSITDHKKKEEYRSQIEFKTQSPDHPILWAADESYYLKFYIFQVTDERL